MNIFPIKHLSFQLRDSSITTLQRLERRTEYSEYLTSQFTDKSFRGKVNQNKFRVISSSILGGALCVMSGIIDIENGKVTVEIHKLFKTIFSIILCLPIIGFFAQLFMELKGFNYVLLVVSIGQILMIRYIFIGIAFKYISRQSLKRLRDVLDIDFQ